MKQMELKQKRIMIIQYSNFKLNQFKHKIIFRQNKKLLINCLNYQQVKQFLA